MPTDEPVVSDARLMGRAVGVYFAELLSTPGVTRSMATRLARDYQFCRFELEPVDDDDDDEEE